MPMRWTKSEEKKYSRELKDLYIRQNKSIKEISFELGIAEQTVFKRLIRLKIKPTPHLKKHYLKRRTDVILPKRYSERIAEFFGIMLGDGHVSHFQILVHLGNKEAEYAEYVRVLISKIFRAPAKISIRDTGYRDVYLGSTFATSWLFKEGFVKNKVRFQVGVPRWIFIKRSFIEGFLRGFFDTDGSVYKIKYGIQISFTNYSLPLLKGLQRALSILGYTPSEVSSHKIYLTKTEDVKRFFKEVNPRNPKHQRRFKQFIHAPVG